MTYELESKERHDMFEFRKLAPLCLIALAYGCVADESIETPDDRIRAVEDVELPPGVRLDITDGIMTWEVSGQDAHVWFRDYLEERILVEPNVTAVENYQILVEQIDLALPEIDEDPGPQFRAKTTTVNLTDTPIGGKPGWKAYAYAKRSGVGTVCVDTKSKVGNNVVDHGESCKWGVGKSVSQTAHTSHDTPTNCHAYAHARAGSKTAFSETYNCPTNTGSSGGSGGSGGNPGNPGNPGIGGGDGGCEFYPIPL